MNVLRTPVRRRLARRLRLASAHLVAVLVALVVALPLVGAPAQAATVTAAPVTSAAQAAPGSVDDGVLRVLLFYKPNFHASHVEGRAAIRDLVNALGTEYNQPVEIEETDNPAAFTTANLATKDTVAFMQTGGVLFDVDQRAALEAYIRGGGGFMGQHYTGWSVGQSEHDVNPFYLKLIGAMSEGHPENPGVRPGRVVNSDAGNALNTGLPAEFNRSDEWYDWVVNPAPNVRTLLSIDESSVNSLGHNGTTHPVTWCQTIDSGSLLVQRHGSRGHRLLRAAHPHHDEERPRLRRRPPRGRLLPPGQGRAGLVERRHAVAARPDQRRADVRRQGPVLRLGLHGLHRRQPLRLERQQLRDAGRPDGDRRLGPRGGQVGRQRRVGSHPQRHLHRPVLLDAGADAAPSLDDDGRR